MPSPTRLAHAGSSSGSTSPISNSEMNLRRIAKDDIFERWNRWWIGCDPRLTKDCRRVCSNIAIFLAAADIPVFIFSPLLGIGILLAGLAGIAFYARRDKEYRRALWVHPIPPNSDVPGRETFDLDQSHRIDGYVRGPQDVAFNILLITRLDLSNRSAPFWVAKQYKLDGEIEIILRGNDLEDIVETFFKEIHRHEPHMNREDKEHILSNEVAERRIVAWFRGISVADVCVTWTNGYYCERRTLKRNGQDDAAPVYFANNARLRMIFSEMKIKIRHYDEHSPEYIEAVAHGVQV